MRTRTGAGGGYCCTQFERRAPRGRFNRRVHVALVTASTQNRFRGLRATWTRRLTSFPSAVRLSQGAVAMTTFSSLSFSSVVRLLYIQNPFYLIGTFLILFGLQQCFGK